MSKSNILKYTGIAVLVFALFTLISALSYLFTWQADQSLMSHPEMMDKGVDVENWGGKLGYMWSRFLVSRCFGLGSFALVFLMGAVAYRLFFWDRHIGLLKTTFITVTGTFLSSLILSVIVGGLLLLLVGDALAITKDPSLLKIRKLRQNVHQIFNGFLFALAHALTSFLCG